MDDQYRPPPPQSHPVTEFRDPVEYRDREGQSSKLLRGIFIVINLVFFGFGLALIIKGAIDLDYYKVELNFWTEHVDKIFKGVGESYDLAAKLDEFDFNAALHGTMIGIGVAICLVSFLGVVAFCTGNVCLICTYTCFLIVFAVIELSIGITGLVLREKIRSYLGEGEWTDDMIENLKYYGLEEFHEAASDKNLTTSGVEDFFDKVQKNYKCCGVNGYDDWLSLGDLDTSQFPGKKDPRTYPLPGDVPESCCKDQEDKQSGHPCGHGFANKKTGEAADHIYTEGCAVVLQDILYNNITLYSGIKICVSLLMVFGILYACAVAKDIKRAR